MNEKRKNLAKDLGIPLEDASRIMIEKERALLQSELKYHIKSSCSLLDRLKLNDAEFAEYSAKDLIKFILARHGSLETLDEISEYIESLSENYLERDIVNKLKDGF